MSIFDNNTKNYNAFDESIQQALSGLNALMMTDEVCRTGRAVLKINTFKKYLLDLSKQVDEQATGTQA